MNEKTPKTQPTPETTASTPLTGEERMRLNKQAQELAMVADRALKIAENQPLFTAQGDMILPSETEEFQEEVASK